MPTQAHISHDCYRRKMAAAVGHDSPKQGYAAIIDLTRELNDAPNTPADTQAATVSILKSLFPPWLPGAFAVMFSKPFPAFSARLNAWATAVTCQWLMGPCSVVAVDDGDGQPKAGQGVKVERCRYLEESGCASVCLNSCKFPTQRFFMEDMGLPLTMTPNYDDFSCEFAFGRTPPEAFRDPALETACFANCPTRHKARLHKSKERPPEQQCPGAVA
ncbi:hypothetical protein ACKKBG_A26805 [Auxenochlorella protothecoides x Auxenochlorella symbiontica]